jgi:hypothetical protein
MTLDDLEIFIGYPSNLTIIYYESYMLVGGATWIWPVVLWKIIFKINYFELATTTSKSEHTIWKRRSRASIAQFILSNEGLILTLKIELENFYCHFTCFLSMLQTSDFNVIHIISSLWEDLSISEETIALALAVPEIWPSKNFSFNSP